MGFFRRMFAFLEEGPRHASSKGKPSRSLMKAAVALNKMSRKPSSDNFRHETVVSNSIVLSQGNLVAREDNSESVMHHSVTATAEVDSTLSVSDSNINFEPEKQMAICIQSCIEPFTMTLHSSMQSLTPSKTHEAV
ncbi:hypothetical protein CSAL01_09351 [Colletotrichum salicis]|uniref:Uncharacterized protein n=1 Tax=Colletotrichum salicis TaxID=1209931 RepID=A0A135V619_9PEZI|nr:hypothetical protein CSAL01_09351 [Colletotrichum salicis]